MSKSSKNESHSINWVAVSEELSILFNLLHYEQQTDNQSAQMSLSLPHKNLAAGEAKSTTETYVTESNENASKQQIKKLLQNVLVPFWSKDSKMYKQMHNFTFLDSLVMPDLDPHGRDSLKQQHFLGGNNSVSSLLHPQASLPTVESLTFNSSHLFYRNQTFNTDQGGCSDFSYQYEDFTQNRYIRDAFVAIYIIIIALSVIGNLMVIFTVWKNNHMRTTTNYYIVNLATCDFLVAIFVMPLKLLEYTAPCTWKVFDHYGLCSFVSFILPVFVFASVLTLVAISIERHYGIVYPLKMRTVSSKSRTKLIIIATWIIPLLFASPYLFCQSYSFNIQSKYGSLSRQICNDRFDDIDRILFGEDELISGRFRKGFFLFLFVTIYLIPLVVIVTTCVRIAMCLLKPLYQEQQESTCGMRMTRRQEESKRRVAKMIITIAIAFIICWSPFYWVSLVSQVQQQSFLRNSNFLFTMLGTHLVGFINSAVNPIIYHIMNDKFRKSFRSILLRIFCCFVPLLQKRRKHSWGARCDGAAGPYCGYVGSSMNDSNQHEIQNPRNSFQRKHNRYTGKYYNTDVPNRHRKYSGTTQEQQGATKANTSVKVLSSNWTANYRVDRQKFDLVIHNTKRKNGENEEACCCPCHQNCGTPKVRNKYHIRNNHHGDRHHILQECNSIEDMDNENQNWNRTNGGSDSCFEDDIDVASSNGSNERVQIRVSCSRESIGMVQVSKHCGEEEFYPLPMLNKTNIVPKADSNKTHHDLEIIKHEHDENLDDQKIPLLDNKITESEYIDPFNYRKYASLEGLSNIENNSLIDVSDSCPAKYKSCSLISYNTQCNKSKCDLKSEILSGLENNHLLQKCLSAQLIASKLNETFITRSKSLAHV